jgi:hypothetical protein
MQRKVHTRREEAAYDMGPDLGPLNGLLERMLAVEAWLIAHHTALPFGVDLFSVSQRLGPILFR